MKKLLYLSAAVLAMASVACAADTEEVLCDFEDFVAYSGNAAAWAALSLQDTVEITSEPGYEGNCLKMVYNYDGDAACQWGGYHSWTYPTKTFSPAIDLSEVDGFSFYVKNDAPTAPMDVMFYFNDAHGTQMRMMYTDLGLTTAHDEWTKCASTFSQLATTGFGYGLQTSIWSHNGRAIDLKNIVEFGIQIYDAQACQADGSFTIMFDSFCYFKGTDNKNTLKEFDFSVDDVTDWVADEGVTVSKDGDTMALAVASVATWTPKGASITLPASIDMSGLSYALVEVEGDPVLAAVSNTVDLRLYDEAGKVASCLFYYIAGTGGAGYGPMNTAGFQTGDNYGRSCWRHGTWNGNAAANADIDLSKINRIGLQFEPQSDGVAGQAATLKVKKITLGASAAKPALPGPPPYKTVTAVRAAGAPVFDGTGSDAQWANAEWATDFTDSDGNVVSEDFKSQFKVLYDDTCLYFLMELYTGPTCARYYSPNISGNQNSLCYYTGSIWTDSWGIWLQPASNTSPGAYQIEPYFATDDSCHQPAGDTAGFMFGTSWTPGWGNYDISSTTCKATETDSKITMEFSVPYASLVVAALNVGGAATQAAPAPGDTWYVQASRVGWLASQTPSSTEDQGHGSLWNVDPANPVTNGYGVPKGALVFGGSADVADWSVF